jgi:hypothetical protein
VRKAKISVVALCGAGLLIMGAGTSFARDQAKGGQRTEARDGQDGQSDKHLETKIQTRFRSDERLKAYDLKVSTDDGVAKLSGEVPNQDHKQRAQRIAQQAGATRVENEIEVNPRVEAKSQQDQLKDEAKAIRAEAEMRAEMIQQEAERRAEQLEERAERVGNGDDRTNRRRNGNDERPKSGY